MTATESESGHAGTAGLVGVSIIAPTRNEAQNLEEFVKRTTAALDGRPIRWEIVFADDSDDDTPQVAARFDRPDRRVRCVHREPAERTDSIAGAVRAALATVDTDIAVVIDADLQHPPEILPYLIGPLVAGEADFAIGTRYAGIGSAEGLGSSWRKLASRSCAGFTRLVFPSYRHCSDMATGLFCFRVAAFGRRDGRSTGFKFLPEALVRCAPRRIAEVPYVFEERVDGLSKARIRDGLTLASALIALRCTTAPMRRVVVIDNPQRFVLPIDVTAPTRAPTA